MDIRSFATAVQMEEVATNVGMHMKRMTNMAEFDGKLCFGHEEDAQRLFESATEKLQKAKELFDDGAADYFAAMAARDSSKEERDVLNSYIRKFRANG